MELESELSHSIAYHIVVSVNLQITVHEALPARLNQHVSSRPRDNHTATTT